MARTLTWGDIIAGCKVHGKATVLAAMHHNVQEAERLQAHLYGGDDSEVRQAGRMTVGILGRLETIIRLNAMTDAEMERLWMQATPRQRERLLARWKDSEERANV